MDVARAYQMRAHSSRAPCHPCLSTGWHLPGHFLLGHFHLGHSFPGQYPLRRQRTQNPLVLTRSLSQWVRYTVQMICGFPCWSDRRLSADTELALRDPRASSVRDRALSDPRGSGSRWRPWAPPRVGHLISPWAGCRCPGTDGGTSTRLWTTGQWVGGTGRRRGQRRTAKRPWHHPQQPHPSYQTPSKKAKVCVRYIVGWEPEGHYWTLFNNVSLRTLRALSSLPLHSNSTLLVLKGTLLNNVR